MLYEVKDGVKADVLNEVVLGTPTLCLGVDTTVVVLLITSIQEQNNINLM